MEVGPRERADGVGALIGGSALHPEQKSTHNVRLAQKGAGQRSRGGIHGCHDSSHTREIGSPVIHRALMVNARLRNAR